MSAPCACAKTFEHHLCSLTIYDYFHSVVCVGFGGGNPEEVVAHRPATCGKEVSPMADEKIIQSRDEDIDAAEKW